MITPGPSPEAVADHLQSAASLLMRRARREDDATDITGARLSALSVVVGAGVLTIGDLAEAEHVRSPTASKLAAELESLGLVTRSPSLTDRRVTEVRPTPKGRWVLHGALRRRASSLVGRLEGLGQDDLATLDRAARILEGVLRQG